MPTQMRSRPISGATIYSVEDLKWIKKALSTTSEKVVGYYSGKLFQRLAGCALDKELVNWFENQRGIVTTSRVGSSYTLHATTHPAGDLYMRCLLRLGEFQAPWCFQAQRRVLYQVN